VISPSGAGVFANVFVRTAGQCHSDVCFKHPFRIGTVEGHKIESLELLTDDENGLLLERTVAYRPFPALKLFRDRLIALNAGKLPADVRWKECGSRR
jgi:hypothetical protein